MTLALGTHITPMPRETLRGYPTLDYGLRGEPDLTVRDMIDHLEGRQFARPPEIERMFAATTPRLPAARDRRRPRRPARSVRR